MSPYSSTRRSTSGRPVSASVVRSRSVAGWVFPCAVSPLCCFPPVVFPPCGVWLGLCVGRVDPALAFIRLQLGVISPRASARQTRAGRCLATAGAPQLHSPAPPQQTRWQARRPADNSRKGARDQPGCGALLGRASMFCSCDGPLLMMAATSNRCGSGPTCSRRSRARAQQHLATRKQILRRPSQSSP